MERERKRKRVENKEIKEKVGVKEKAEEKDAAAVDPPPTEAEVDEFFAILKRMQVAIRYFEKTSAQNNSSHSGGHAQKLTASEEEVIGVKVGENKVENSGLDLNTIPASDPV